MKRQTLESRARFLHEKMDQLESAAKDCHAANVANPGSLHERQRARRALGEAGIAYGLACKRYLGGREG